MSEPQPDGSWADRPVPVQHFRPGAVTTGLQVGALWAVVGYRFLRLATRSQATVFDLWLAGAGGLVLTLAIVVHSVLTGTRIGGSAVVVRTPFRGAVRFGAGTARAAGWNTLVGPAGSARLPTWWLSAPDIDRLRASVEFELGVRFPDRPPPFRLPGRRRRSRSQG